MNFPITKVLKQYGEPRIVTFFFYTYYIINVQTVHTIYRVSQEDIPITISPEIVKTIKFYFVFFFFLLTGIKTTCISIKFMFC